MICGRTPEELIREIEQFHGFVAPGLLIGAYMVDLAYRIMGKKVEMGAIVETKHCLPDAVQLFTPCTIGNGWLKVLDLDKFALTLYDRSSFMGYRAWIDLNKSEAFPTIHKWFMGLVPKKDSPKDVLISDIIKAGDQILSASYVLVTRHRTREKKGDILVCSVCHEAYSSSQGINMCHACQGNSYYERLAITSP